MSWNWGSQKIWGLEVGVNGEKTAKRDSRPHLDKIVKLAKFTFRPITLLSALITLFQVFNIHILSLDVGSSFTGLSQPGRPARFCIWLFVLMLIWIYIVTSQSIEKGQKNRRMYWVDPSQKKVEGWQISLWKNDQQHWPFGKCKLNPQWDTMAHLPEGWIKFPFKLFKIKKDCAKYWWECKAMGSPIHCWRGWKTL